MPETFDIQDLVLEAELLHVAILELSAGRTDLYQSNDALMASFEDNDYDADMDFGVALDFDDEDSKRFRVRLQTEIESDPGIIRAILAAEYELDTFKPRDLNEDVMLEFVNKVAVMTLLPYVRQTVADISQRVFTYPLTMPLFKAGKISFT